MRLRLTVDTCSILIKHNFVSLISKYSRSTIYLDSDSWYAEVCTYLKLEHRLHSPLMKRT